MRKTILAAVMAAISGAVLLAPGAGGTASAAGPDWGLNGANTITFTCTSCSYDTPPSHSVFAHTLTAANTNSAGAFTANDSSGGTLSGNIVASRLTAHLVYPPGTPAAYNVDISGRIARDGIASGVAVSHNGPYSPELFSWTMAQPLLSVGKVLDITMHVANDEDSGNVGYWALDQYEKHVKVWRRADGTFYAEVDYEGTWRTFKGALSPGNGVAQQDDGMGSMKGGYVATFTGDFTPGALKTRGDIGARNCIGTKADIMLGTYGNGQTGPTCWSWLSNYFSSSNGFTDFTQPTWGWTYRYRNQVWKNTSTANQGDIVIGPGKGDDDDHDDHGHWSSHHHGGGDRD